MSSHNRTQSGSSKTSASKRSLSDLSTGGLEQGDIFKLSSGSCSVKDGCLSSVVPELSYDLDPLKPSSSLSKIQKKQSLSIIDSSLSNLKDQITQFESRLKDAKRALEGGGVDEDIDVRYRRQNRLSVLETRKSDTRVGHANLNCKQNSGSSSRNVKDQNRNGRPANASKKRVKTYEISPPPGFYASIDDDEEPLDEVEESQNFTSRMRGREG